jgi:nucleotide-binding universal stress UspA family protein
MEPGEEHVMDAASVEPGYAVVAVDGSDEGYAAVEFAAHEASRRGLTLRIGHVRPARLPVGPMVSVAADEGLEGYASETVARAVRAATDAAPHIVTTTHVLVGGRVTEIVRLSEQARFIVVGRRSTTGLDRVWTGGTLDGIVSRARCPVFVAPQVTAHANGPARVVVGFKSAGHAAELFESAFGAAHELSAELYVLHAWKMASGYDDIIASRVNEAVWTREQTEEIRSVVAPWQESYPDVPVSIEVVHESPVRALVEASRAAERLVLVKPLHGALIHHLGRTARGALRCAECPIEVVQAKPSGELTMPPFSVEREGELVP